VTQTRPTFGRTESPDVFTVTNAQLSAPERKTTPTPDTLPQTRDVLRQAAGENFSVASRLLPRAVRAHLLAVYGFARLADDIGDEADGDRLALLDWLEAELASAARGAATHPLLVRLTPTIREFELSLDPFHRLIEANRRDQFVHRYETFDDLIGYCNLSAAPVGELVLRIFDVSTPARVALSDDVCNALQLVEHIQDVAEDAAGGRIYLPQADLRAYGCTEDALQGRRTSAPLRAVLRYEAGRARRLLASASPLTRQLPVQSRVAVCGFAAGGLAALDAIERADFEVLGQSCRPRPARLGAHLLKGLLASWTTRAR
jgi:squalene synthase HpnC